MSAKHIGFIMDGNGRWAVAHGMSRAEGYAHGLVALYKVAKRCSERGVEAVSVYALSTENLNRPGTSSYIQSRRKVQLDLRR